MERALYQISIIIIITYIKDRKQVFLIDALINIISLKDVFIYDNVIATLEKHLIVLIRVRGCWMGMSMV